MTLPAGRRWASWAGWRRWCCSRPASGCRRGSRVLFFLIYFALALAITRMRAELGTPIHDLHFTGPDWILAEGFGTRALDPRTLTSFSMFFEQYD